MTQQECNIDAKQILSFNQDIQNIQTYLKGVDGDLKVIEENDKGVIDALNKINDRLCILESLHHTHNKH